MRIHLDELQLAREHSRDLEFETLTPDQVRLILNRGRSLHKWFKTHEVIHALINGIAIASIFVADWLLLIGLPRLLLRAGQPATAGSLILSGILVGLLDSWFFYSIATFSLHEGASHHVIFPGDGAISRLARFLTSNMCRVAGADPGYYSTCHMAHHAKFGTEDDPEFLNFVIPRRFWRSLLPLCAFVNFSDFLSHRPLTYTRSRVISEIVSAIYIGAHLAVAYWLYGPVFTITLLVVLPHAGFYADRLRQFTEHNLMPLENSNGARSFGCGVWGMVIGGGPWGQPCHMAHHLVPSIPWYQQLILHYYMRGLFTRKQREQFLVKPVVGYPLLLWRVLRRADLFWRLHAPQIAGMQTSHLRESLGGEHVR